MPTVQKRKRRDGSVYFIAWVRVRPFKPVSRGGFGTRDEARTWAEDHERELKDARQKAQAPPDLPRLTLAQLVGQFLDDPTTQALGYYGDLQMLLAWWVNEYAAVRVLRIGATTLREARARLLSGGRANATVNRYLSALRSCWNWARGAEIIPSKLVWPPKLMLREPKWIVRYLSDEELAALLKAADDHSLPMHAAILVSIATGVRMSELRRFRWSDVDFERKRIKVLLSKNSESRGGYLPDSAIAALKKLKGTTILGRTVFVDEAGQPVTKGWVEYRWNAIRETAGLKNFRWHDLRHSCASLLAQNGATLLEIGSVLGHKSPSATKRYAHLVEGAPVTGHTKLDEKLGGGK